MKIAIWLFVAFTASAAMGLGWSGFMAVAVLVLLVFYFGRKAKPDVISGEEAEHRLQGADASVPTKARVIFDYVDAKGSPTRRTVSVKTHDRRRKTGILRAFCHDRGAMRSFRFDRISNAVDADTGELLPDLQKHLNGLTVRR